MFESVIKFIWNGCCIYFRRVFTLVAQMRIDATAWTAFQLEIATMDGPGELLTKASSSRPTTVTDIPLKDGEIFEDEATFYHALKNHAEINDYEYRTQISTTTTVITICKHHLDEKWRWRQMPISSIWKGMQRRGIYVDKLEEWTHLWDKRFNLQKCARKIMGHDVKHHQGKPRLLSSSRYLRKCSRDFSLFVALSITQEPSFHFSEEDVWTFPLMVEVWMSCDLPCHICCLEKIAEV